MRREYVETISSQAAPSPARHLLTSSAPSPTVTAPATPTIAPLRLPPRIARKAGRAGGQPVVKRALRPPKGESSSPAGAVCGGRVGLPSAGALLPRRKAPKARGATAPAVTIIA